MLTLSVLDQSPIPSGWTPAEAVRATIALAQACDRLGYKRFWMSEHHSSASLAGTAPEILIPVVAAATNRIRVGSGGVMLSHYSSLKVAEKFRVIEALYPGRIDLGIGRAPGSDQLTAEALLPGQSKGVDRFPQQIRDLVGFLYGQLEPEHEFARISAMPSGASSPDIWLLGSSGYSAAYAAHFGLAFSFAHFISPLGGPDMVKGYRDRFQPSGMGDVPRASVGVSVLCADTDEEAERLAASTDLWRLKRDYGKQGPIPTVQEALDYQYTDYDRARIAQTRGRAIIGGPESVKNQVQALADRYEVDELVVVSICHEFSARVHSYELLADMFGLTPAAPA